MRQGRIVPAASILWGANMDGDVAIMEGEAARGDAPYAGTGITTWNRFEEHTGKQVGVCHFSDKWVAAGEGGLQWDGFGAGASERCVSRGAIPMKSIGGPSGVLTSVLAGTFDASIQSWAEAAAAFGYPVILRPWWEMNISEGSWAWARRANYIEAWRYLYNKIKPIASNVSFAWVPNAIYDGPSGEYLLSMFPGESYVDMVGMDGYNFGTNPVQPDKWRSPEEIFLPTYAVLRALAPNKQLILGEVGCSEFGGSKPGWITSFLGTTLRQMPEVKAMVWFNDNIVKGEGRNDWPIESSAASQDSFKSAIGSGYFKGAGTLQKGPVLL